MESFPEESVQIAEEEESSEGKMMVFSCSGKKKRIIL